MSFFCAVPPGLHVDPEGVGVIPAAGPYYVADYRPGERVLIRRNRFYGGAARTTWTGSTSTFGRGRRASSSTSSSGRGRLGLLTAPIYLDPSRNLIRKYGLNKSRFFVRPGLTLRALLLNSSRPLFKDNPSLRRAVNLALNRRELSRTTASAQGTGTPTDQLLPALVPGFRDARINALTSSDVRRAKSLARGHTRADRRSSTCRTSCRRSRWRSWQTPARRDRPRRPAAAGPVPRHERGYLGPLGSPGEAWDIAIMLWTPDYIDPYAYVNRLLDARFIGGRTSAASTRRSTTGSCGSGAPRGRRALPQVRGARRRPRAQRGAARSGRFFDEPTLVSKRVGCIVLRPVLDLTAACLKP